MNDGPISDTLTPADAAGRAWDAVVLGAGPAGAIAARQLASDGAAVLLVDKKSFPRPKTCGGCLNGQAIAVLREVGLGNLLDGLGAIEPDAFVVHLRGRTARFPMPEGVVVSRTKFDAALVRAAVAAGAELLQDTQAVVVPGDDSETRTAKLMRRGEAFEARGKVVIVAAGLGNACLDREPGVTTRVARDSRVGVGCALDWYPDAYRGRTIGMAVGREGYLGLVCTEDGRLNAAAAVSRRFLRSHGSPAEAAAALLAEAGCPPIPEFRDAAWHGTVPLTRTTRPIGGRRLYLVGDATGYVEPFTGQGMAWALVSGRALAPIALKAARGKTSAEASAREWSALHARLIGRKRLICRGLATASKHPRLARAVFAAAERAPALAQFLMRRINTPPTLCEAT